MNIKRMGALQVSLAGRDLDRSPPNLYSEHMAREMTREETGRFLTGQVVGRIGCHAVDRTYVVPIAYAYRDGALWGFSHEGMKIDMMRSDPRVCVEIDRVEHLGSWASVILWGRYEELSGEEASRGASIIAQRLGETISDGESRRRLEEALRQEPRPIVYRIVIEQTSGRIEGDKAHLEPG